MNEAKIDVSDSRVNVWNFCPRSWGLQYVDGWEKKIKAAPLNKGSMFHSGVEVAVRRLAEQPKHPSMTADELRTYFEMSSPSVGAAIMGSSTEVGLNPEQVEELREQRDIAYWMTKHYLHFLANVLEHKMIVGVEHKFEDCFSRGLRTPVNNRGIIDLILFDPFDNTVHIIDHKSARDILGADERLSYSQQLIGYLRWAKNSPEILKEINTKFPEVKARDLKYRTHLRVVRNLKPNEPQILKNGTVSARAISTIRSVYEAALADQSEAISEKQAQRLESLPESWHTVIEQMFSYEEIDTWELELSVHAERMEQARRMPIYRTKSTKNCPECPLKIVCKFGEDPEFVQRKEEK